MLTSHKDGIYQALFKCKGLDERNIELELRFQQIHEYEFKRVVAKLEQMSPLKVESAVSTNLFIDNSNRVERREDGVYDTSKATLFRAAIASSSTVANPVVVALSYEKNDIVFDETIVENVKFTRVKKRRSFLFSGFKVDCSIVDTIAGSNIKTSYEIEIEALEITPDNLDVLGAMDAMFHRINLILIEFLIINEFNKLVDSPRKDGRIDTRSLSTARDLKKEDITYDGLANGNYVVTTKADGVRSLLGICRYGIWKLTPQRDMDDIERVGDTPPQLEKILPIYLDCEEVFDQTHERELIIPFDILVMRDKEVQKLPLIGERSRYTYTKKITGTIAGNVNVALKPYFNLGRTLESMKSAFVYATEFADAQPYENDGFIITPVMEKYKISNPGKVRVLSVQPEICKLKPWEKLSIDLLRKNNKVYVTDQTGALVEFIGTEKNPFSTERNINLDGFPDGEITEAAPTLVGDRVVLVAYRSRHDKVLPNGAYVARSIWNSLHDHISLETLFGTDLKSVRMYHNEIKRHVIEGIEARGIVDIGSGRLGDLKKWEASGIKNVLAIEPDSSNIEEANRRLAKSSGQVTVRLVQAGGEDTAVIVNEIDDIGDLAIVSMLSMSFFFIDDRLDQFCATLRGIATRVGKPVWFHFFTLDGTSVKEFFNGKSGKATFDIVKMEYDNLTETLKTDIEGTIVDEYTEGLPNLAELVTRVTPTGESPELELTRLDDPATNELGLSRYVFNENNLKFNRLYSFGRMKIYPDTTR